LLGWYFHRQPIFHRQLLRKHSAWRSGAELVETEQVVQRFLSRPDEYDAETCGPGPFSLGLP